MKCFMTHLQDCRYEKDIQERQNQKSPKSIFMISPFGYPYDEIFEETIKPAGKDARIEVWRADVAFQLGFVMCTKICKLMQMADYVVADLTADNPNVFYELGLAWGFGRKIVILRDEDVLFSDPFREIFGDSEQRILSYAELRKQLSPKGPDKLEELLERKAIDADKECTMKNLRKPGAYIRKKKVCVCHRAGRPDAKFYVRTIQEAVPKGWELDQMPLGSKTPAESLPMKNAALKISLPEKLASSKIVIVDVTHYDKKPDTSIYFALGLSHAMGRGTIPITNQAKYSAVSPFDVRGLWQVYFKKLEELKKGLSGILNVILPDYDMERQDYPLRFIWNEVLARAGLRVISCSRGAGTEAGGAGTEADRPSRTHVDKWDYTSVAELASFLGRKYKQAAIAIEPPREKADVEALEDESRRSKHVEKIEEDLRDEKSRNSSIIIVGSPDVNDYAEIVLARIWGVPPYGREQQKCKRSNTDLQDKCWKCNDPNNSRCIGKRGYLFYKTTVDTKNPRKVSDFFRDPPSGEDDCVVWYGSQLECTRGANAGTTFGVLTIFKDKEQFFARDGGVDRWIILLSGFTGVATYILTQVLTTLKVRTKKTQKETETEEEEKGMVLQEALEERGLKLENGVQVLVSVDYESEIGSQNYDSRSPTGYAICDIKPLPKPIDPL